MPEAVSSRDKGLIKNIWLDEKAQAMAEYAVLVFFVVISFAAFWAVWSPVLRRYYDRIAFVIRLPQP